MTMPFYVSPEQFLQDKAEYAKKGISRGRSIAVLEVVEGILLVADNPSHALHKISEIYDRVAFAGVGKYSEFENLRKSGIRYADLKGFLYSREDVTGRSLANAYSELLGNSFSQEMKPMEVEIILADLGSGERSNEIYRISFDGSIFDESLVSVVGGRSEQLKTFLRERVRPGVTMSEGLGLVRAGFLAQNENGHSVENMEAALLERAGNGRCFRRLSSAEIAGFLSEGEGGGLAHGTSDLRS